MVRASTGCTRPHVEHQPGAKEHRTAFRAMLKVQCSMLHSRELLVLWNYGGDVKRGKSPGPLTSRYAHQPSLSMIYQVGWRNEFERNPRVPHWHHIAVLLYFRRLVASLLALANH